MNPPWTHVGTVIRSPWLGGFVYRCYDAAGFLLYVGLARTPVYRLGAHRGKWWWPQVASVFLVGYDRYHDAACDEVAAIHREFPLYNIRSRRRRVY